jgi:hypothetical protein
MTSQGSASGRFTRAIAQRNMFITEAAQTTGVAECGKCDACALPGRQQPILAKVDQRNELPGMLLLGGAAPAARANTSARAAAPASGLMRLMKEVLQGRERLDLSDRVQGANGD